MLFSRYRKASEEAEVNLIPVMNLFVTLIPFLLLAAAFYHVGVIPTSLPSQSEASDVADDEVSVTVNLLVEKDTIEMSASSTMLDEATLEELSMTIPRKGKAYDFELLAKALHEIKLRYDKSDTVIVLPEDRIPYSDLVMILDTARERTMNKGTENEVRIPLFPVVVLSRKV